MKKNRTHQDDRRNRWFADPRLQCGLLGRTILYWLYSVCTIVAVALIWIVFAQRPDTAADWMNLLWLNCGPLAIASVLILPLALLDCWRFSRRFAGPMVRFRQSLHELANGDPADPLELREGDFWNEFARDLNKISQRIKAANANGVPSSGEVDPASPASTATYDAMEETVEFHPGETLSAPTAASQGEESGSLLPLPTASNIY